MGIKIFLALKEVTETRFLGIIFDPTLDWNAHIKSLLKKLKTSFAIIKRISSYIPPENHKNIYHTLFESHLSYCISVWGGTKKKLIDRIFTLQKSVIRCLFGDYESFLDKFNTAARTRPIGEQFLGSNFYYKEHAKQLFSKHNILTVQNLLWYIAVNELAKLISLKNPSILFEQLCLSIRNNQNIIILRNNKLGNCFHNSLLNAFNCWNILVKKLKIPPPHDMVPCLLKRKVKNFLLDLQKTGCPNTWEPNNFIFS